MPTTQERIDAGFALITPLQKLADRTAIGDVVTYWQHFFTTGVIIEPGVSASQEKLNARVIRIVDPAQRDRGLRRESPLRLLPLFAEDQLLGSPVQALWQYSENCAAVYMSVGNLIYFRCPTVETSAVLSTTLAHELGHAYRAFCQGRIGHPGKVGLPFRVLAEEVDMHSLTYRIWREHDPRVYDQIMAQGLIWLKQQFAQHESDRAFIPLNSEGPWRKGLSDILGPPANEGNRYARSFEFSIHVHFIYADQQPWNLDDRIKYKTSIMRSIYAAHRPNAGQSLQF